MPFGPVMNVFDIVNDPHFNARDMIVEVDHPGSEAGTAVKMTGTPGTIVGRSPFLGEHTAEELRAAGMDEQRIQSLLDRKVALTENEKPVEEVALASMPGAT